MQLETQLHRLRNEMDDVLLDTKELEEQLHEAVKERATMEMLLLELEKELDEAILKIKLLEGEVNNQSILDYVRDNCFSHSKVFHLHCNQVRDLKDEAQRWKEVKAKALWSYLDQDGRHLTGADNTDKSPYRLDCEKKQVIEDLCKDEMMTFARMISKEGVIAHQREVALSRSLFSVLLSLVVGVISWEAKDPCMPLVIALFVVVTMSLLSVLQLFARIEHKPVSESLALLSINWFILGTLAYPVFPKIARFLAPSALSFLRQALE